MTDAMPTAPSLDEQLRELLGDLTPDEDRKLLAFSIEDKENYEYILRKTRRVAAFHTNRSFITRLEGKALSGILTIVSKALKTEAKEEQDELQEEADQEWLRKRNQEVIARHQYEESVKIQQTLSSLETAPFF